jgi:hypothetical protein
MTETKKIFAEKKFPPWISCHSVFNKNKEIKKVFPEIGLPNCEKEIEVDNVKEANEAAKNLVVELRQEITHRIETLGRYVNKHPDKVGAKRKKKLENTIKLLSNTKKLLAKSTNCITLVNGKITLNLPSEVADCNDKIAFKAGEGIFRIYNKLNDTLRDGHFLVMEKLENLGGFKDFSTKNVPALKYKLRFSSEGSEGLWDIATMSMRGISSCQSWGSGNHTHIVGSLVDPFTGIIYLTSGGKFNEYGSKMIRRCVVRFMVDEKGIPFIGLENMYPAMDRGALNSFVNFIKEMTDKKFSVIYLGRGGRRGSYVPMSKIVGSLTDYDKPYRDSGTQYKAAGAKCGVASDNGEQKLNALYSTYPAKVIAAARSIKMGEIKQEARRAFKSLRGGDYRVADCSYEFYNQLQNSIVRHFRNIKTDKYDDYNVYLKEGIETFIADGGIEKKVSAVCKSAQIENARELDDETIKKIASVASNKLNDYFAAELKKIKIVEKKPGKKSADHAAIAIYTKLLS